MRKLSFLLLLMLSCSFMRAQSSMSLKQLTDSISGIVEQEHIPGLMLGITTKDSVIFSGGFGYAVVESKRKVDGQTLFRLGSITKMFVSLAILKLVEDGKLSLNDELKKVAPEILFQNKWENTDPVRIVNLLEHTAGFDDMKLNRFCSQDGKGYKGLDMVTFEKNSLVCRWRPGERYSYSNPGYVILGYLIEKFSGRPYDQFIDDIFLRPLGMHSTNFDIVGKYPDKDVAQYVVHGTKTIKVPTVTCLIAPAGALWSSSDDMLKFVQFMLKSGEPVFTDSVITEMETVHSTLAAKAGLHTGYGLGNFNVTVYDEQMFHGHDGLMGTCYSSLGYNRKMGIGFVLSSNGNNPNFRIKDLVAEFAGQNKIAPNVATIPLDKQSIRPLLGYYSFESPRNEIAGFKDRLMILQQLVLDGDNLFMKDLFGGKRKLLQTSHDQFVLEGFNEPTVILTRNKEGKNVLLNNGNYFEQSTNYEVWISRGIVLLALFFAISSFVPGFISFVSTASGRQKWRDLPLKILPMISILLLTWAVVSLLKVQQETYLLSELNTINSRTLIIFLGTLLFGVFSLAHLGIVIARFRKMKRFPAWYWLITALSLCYITIFLFQNGWIGLRTWSM